MRQKVKLHRLSDTTDDFVVVSWLVELGATVSPGDALLSVETDKIDVDIEAPVGGTVVELLVEAGQDVHTGDPVCVIEW